MTLTLNKNNWTGSGPFTQNVTVSGYDLTIRSKVDLQPTADQISRLIADGVSALTIENNNGTLIAHSIGNTPGITMTVQCTIKEVT